MPFESSTDAPTDSFFPLTGSSALDSPASSSDASSACDSRTACGPFMASSIAALYMP